MLLRYVPAMGMKRREDVYVTGLPARSPAEASDDFIALAHTRAGREIADIGCGYGAYIEALRDLGHEAIGFELNQAYVREARRRGLDVRQSDGAGLPLPDDAVDSALLFE